MKPRTLWQVQLPPLPSEPSGSHHLIWHPQRHELWLLDLTLDEVWRVRRDGTGERLFDAKKLGIPSRLGRAYTHGSGFYFDTARGTPVWFIVGYEELILGALDGASFKEIPQKKGITPASSDVFVFDPRRGVLVHFAGTSDTSSDVCDERAKRGGLTVRELGADGTWRETGAPPLADSGLYPLGGWDEHLRMAILVEDAKQQTYGWDGTQWHKLGRYPTLPWRPFVASQAPGTGSLVIVQKERSQGDAGECLELVKGKWVRRDVGKLSGFSGMARAVDTDETFLLGPSLGEDAVTSALGRYVNGRLEPVGPAAPWLTSGSSAGPVRFLARAVDLFGRDERAPQRFTVGAGGLVPAATLAQGIAYVCDAAGDISVTSGGQVLVDGKKRGTAPRGFTSRERTSLGSDGNGTLLLVGGDGLSLRQRLTDTWSFDGAWKKFLPKQAPPAVVEASVIHDPIRRVWLLVEGRDKQLRRVLKTSELSEEGWETFPSRFSDEKKAGTTTFDAAPLLALDAPSGQVVRVRTEPRKQARLYVYRGQGAWLLVGTLDDLGHDRALAWDAARRVIVAARDGQASEYDVGAALDANRQVSLAPAAARKAPRRQKEAPPAERVAFRFRFPQAAKAKRGGKGGATGKASKTRIEESEDVIGGLPPYVSVRAWPRCQGCRQPMTHLLTLHAHPERLPLARHAALAVFLCLSGKCDLLGADSKQSAVVFSLPGAQGTKSARATPLTERRAAYERAVEPDPSRDESPELEPGAKVGGYPCWVQGDETPSCPTCRKPMRFVAQLDSLDGSLTPFDESGDCSLDGVVFCCEADETGTVVMQFYD